MTKTFKRSEQTDSIVRYLASHEKGARVSYAELSKFTGQPVSASDSHLTYARHILVREHAQAWVAVRGEGIKRLNDREMAERQPSWFMRTARNKLRRGKHESEVVDIKQLDINEQSKFGTNCLQQHLALQSLSKATHTKLEKISRGSSNDLPAFNILEWNLPLMSLKSKR